MARAAFKAVGAGQPPAWKVRFLRRSVAAGYETAIEKRAVNSAPGSTRRSESPVTSALVGAVIGSKQMKSSPRGANT